MTGIMITNAPAMLEASGGVDNDRRRVVIMKSVPLGSRFGILTVQSGPHRRQFTNKVREVYTCLCDCGNTRDILKHNLVLAKSCGCQTPPLSFRSHGDSYTRLYRIYKAMRARCENPNNDAWEHYGGRGIKICSEWGDYIVFREWALAAGYADLSIERNDVNGNYEPGNCRWITQKEQCRNTRQNRPMTAFGETKILFDWAEDPRCIVGRQTLQARLRYGWEFETALITPVMSRSECGSTRRRANDE